MARLVHRHVELLWTRWSSRSVLFASPLVKEDDQQIQDSTNHTLNAAKRRILIKVSAPKYINVKCESRKQISLSPWRENDTLQYVSVGLYKHTADSATTHTNICTLIRGEEMRYMLAVHAGPILHSSTWIVQVEIFTGVHRIICWEQNDVTMVNGNQNLQPTEGWTQNQTENQSKNLKSRQLTDWYPWSLTDLVTFKPSLHFLESSNLYYWIN